jgi:hypothetical protein
MGHPECLAKDFIPEFRMLVNRLGNVVDVPDRPCVAQDVLVDIFGEHLGDASGQSGGFRWKFCQGLAQGVIRVNGERVILETENGIFLKGLGQ